MAITVIPRSQSGGEAFTEGFSPYLQMAFQAMLKRKMEDQQRQKNLDLARQTNPELFTETTPLSAYQKYLPQGVEMNLAPGLTPERQTQYASQLTQAKGIKIPESIRKFAFNKEKLGMPTINVSTGEVSYKPEDAFSAYYRSLLPKAGAGEPTKPQDNVVYRDMTGSEVPKEQAEADITSGNTNYYTFKKEVTKSGIKETPISKPEDLQKMQQQKEKSGFVISQARDALNTIDEVEKGIGYFGAFGQFVPKEIMPGSEYYNWRVNVDKLLSGKMIELMTQMKEASKTGATGFGQLSEKEGQILREASTALKRGLAPDKAQEYLNNMKTALQKVIEGRSGQQTQPQGQGGLSLEELLAEKQRRMGR